MQKEFYYMICLIVFTYVGIFIYLKILLKYKLTDMGIVVSFVGLEREFIRFDDIISVSLSSVKNAHLNELTKFVNISLPIPRILIIVNRNHNYGFGQIYTGFSIYPWNTKDFYQHILKKIGNRNEKV
jgi:hypothetical protein